MKFRIRDAAWQDFLHQNNKDLNIPNPGPQEIKHSRNGIVQLVWPHWYWVEDRDLELCSE